MLYPCEKEVNFSILLKRVLIMEILVNWM